MNWATNNNQRGFSLVELMVAMAVSLVLMLGIVQIYLGNKDSYRTNSELAALNQNARLARFTLGNAIAPAGYIVDLNADPAHVFPDGFISDAHDDSLSYAPNSDSITIRFESDGTMNNCLGHVVDPKDEPTDEESDEDNFVHFTLYVDNTNEFECVTYDDNTGETKSQEPLINNVVLMKVRFGLDTNPHDNRYGVDTYVNDLDTDMADQVRSVRVQLVLKSESEIRTTELQDEDGFIIAGETGDFDPSDTYHAYVMVDKIIALRNLLP